MRGIKTRDSGKWKKWGMFFVLSVVLILLLNSLGNVYRKKRSTDEALAGMNAELVKLENRKGFLDNSIEKMKTKEGLEFEIRKKLNVAEAGESVAIIVDEPEASTTPVAKPSVWQKIKNLFSDTFK